MRIRFLKAFFWVFILVAGLLPMVSIAGAFIIVTFLTVTGMPPLYFGLGLVILVAALVAYFIARAMTKEKA